MQKKTIKGITITILIAFIVLIAALIKNNGSLFKMPNKQLADVGYTTQIGNKTYSIANQIENDIVPTIAAGMIPLKQDGDYWTIVDRTDNSWCNYANGQPAYIMLNDGKYQSEEYYKMPDTKEVAKPGTQINKASADLGSIYMWIPRYAYNELGEIIYIKQDSSVAGSWKMPDIFTYKTEKENYALAGIWVECNSTEAAALTNKITQMNTEDSLYGFIANTKTAIMTEDEQETIQIVVDNLNKITGNNTLYYLDTANINHAIIRIVNTNTLEPTKTLGHVYNEENKIEISIKHGTITKVINGDGEELTLTGDKYIQASSEVIYPYIAIDTNGNLREVEFDNVLLVRNAKELSKFRDNVNAGNNYAGWTVVQTEDIDMSDICGENIGSWEPIGATYSLSENIGYFEGIYDGRTNIIDNLYISQDVYANIGMFTGLAKGGMIKNIILNNIYICNIYNSDDDNTRTGGITGLNYGKIENCAVTSGRILARKQTKTIHVGGIVGNDYDNTEIIGCYNKADLYAYSNKNISTSYVKIGGIAGYSCNGTITNCYNEGNITGNSYYDYIGGIVGASDGEIVKNCYNIGELLGIGITEMFGGITGYSYNSSTIINSYSINNATNDAIQVEKNILKTYADTLGNEFLIDNYNLNNGYPILKWEIDNNKINASADLNEKNIEIKIIYNANKIEKVINENGVELVKKDSNTYIELANDGKHKYTIIDGNANKRIISFNVHIIDSSKKFKRFKDEVNAGNDFYGVKVIQTSDIDMSDVCGENICSWEPIGATGVYFAGIYDGRFHTISNIFINTDEYEAIGMFKQTKKEAIIQNFIMENVYINNKYNIPSNSTLTGSVVGKNSGIIRNVGIESGNINVRKDSKEDISNWTDNAAGGIVGTNNQFGEIRKCYNKANVNNEENSNKSNRYVMVGGIVGITNPNTIIDNCYNEGTIYGKCYKAAVGGVIGTRWRFRRNYY